MQIRTLQLRRAVLTTLARRSADPEKMDHLHRLATLSEAERRRLVGDFLDAAFGGAAADPGFAGIMRSMTPELPDNPDADQVAAWIELAELSEDPDFRACIRRLAEQHATDRARSGTLLRRDPVAAVRDHATPALAAASTRPALRPIRSSRR